MSPNTKFALKALASVFLFGFVWIINNQASVITLAAIVVVWLVNILAKSFKIQLQRGWLTAILYVLSFGLVILFDPSIMPALPVLPADSALAIGALITWSRELALVLLPYQGAAMSIYNILLKDVLDMLTTLLPVSTETGSVG